MPYLVEILVATDAFADDMAQMRTWLDHQGRIPLAFQSSARSSHRLAVRVAFAVAAEADAFARAFGGTLVLPN